MFLEVQGSGGRRPSDAPGGTERCSSRSRAPEVGDGVMSLEVGSDVPRGTSLGRRATELCCFVLARCSSRNLAREPGDIGRLLLRPGHVPRGRQLGRLVTEQSSFAPARCSSRRAARQAGDGALFLGAGAMFLERGSWEGRRRGSAPSRRRDVPRATSLGRLVTELCSFAPSRCSSSNVAREVGDGRRLLRRRPVFLEQGSWGGWRWRSGVRGADMDARAASRHMPGRGRKSRISMAAPGAL
jgi:hypothetical protein